MTVPRKLKRGVGILVSRKPMCVGNKREILLKNVWGSRNLEILGGNGSKNFKALFRNIKCITYNMPNYNLIVFGILYPFESLHAGA